MDYLGMDEGSVPCVHFVCSIEYRRCVWRPLLDFPEEKKSMHAGDVISILNLERKKKGALGIKRIS
jgi:hypothetical protein